MVSQEITEPVKSCVMSNFYLYTLVTGTGGHSSSMIIIRYIMNQIFVFSRNLTGDKHDCRAQ